MFQPRKSKCVYLSEEGKKKARKLLGAYNLSDKDILEKFEFRNIEHSEIDQVIATGEYRFRDEFFTDASLHNPEG